MLDAAVRNSLALFDHPVGQIARAGHDAATIGSVRSKDGYRLRGIVLTGNPIVLEVFAICRGRSQVGPAEPVLEGQLLADTPAILPEKLQRPKVETAIKTSVALDQRGVVSEQQVGQSKAAVVRIQDA